MIAAHQLPDAETAKIRNSGGTILTQMVNDAGLDERAFLRRFADLEVSLRGTTGNVFSGTIENISESGCLVTLQGSAEPKAERVLAIKTASGGVMVGRVVWSYRNKVGIRFLFPLDQASIERHVRFSLQTRLSRAKLSSEVLDALPRAARRQG